MATHCVNKRVAALGVKVEPAKVERNDQSAHGAAIDTISYKVRDCQIAQQANSLTS
jgi:hypothetical protein